MKVGAELKILLVEGIATSGKSSLIEKLSGLLKEQRVTVFGESDTHMPIMDKPDQLHIEFFKSLIIEATKTDADLIIFDRLHYTQAFRAKTNIAAYAEIENLLAANNTLVSYLMVDEAVVAERVTLAVEHRDDKWGEYVQTRGKSFKEIAEYYILQQQNQLELLSKSKLTSKVFNTTHHEYEAIADTLIKEWYDSV